MLFPTSLFIFIFLPCCLFGYFVIFRKSRMWKNIFLTLCSLFFYAWGEPVWVILLIFSATQDYICGKVIGRARRVGSNTMARVALIVSITTNLGLLGTFKYLDFFLENLGLLLQFSPPILGVALPIGISFYTFQTLSYTIDVYRGKVEVQKRYFDFLLFVSLFPSLVAGPIIRYESISEQIQNRKETFDDFSAGLCRFVIGLAKKVIIADNLAFVADAAFAADERSVVFAWMGVIAFTFQIFFDFSGYSDMAIGMSRMFGFKLLENFNYPYIAKSISDFWRRWHISLGTWFRDYVYFPLGGSRVSSKMRLIFNLFVVWLLTGLWHGANWTFIAWGLLYFVLIAIEKAFDFDKKAATNKAIALFGHIYTMFFVVMGWVLFRAESFSDTIAYMKDLFALNASGFISDTAIFWMHETRYFYLIALIASLPIGKIISKKVENNRVAKIAYPILIVGLFLIAISYVVMGNHNPFIYFDF